MECYRFDETAVRSRSRPRRKCSSSAPAPRGWRRRSRSPARASRRSWSSSAPRRPTLPARHRRQHRDDGAAALLGPRGAGPRGAAIDVEWRALADADAGRGGRGHADRGRLPRRASRARVGQPDRARPACRRTSSSRSSRSTSRTLPAARLRARRRGDRASTAATTASTRSATPAAPHDPRPLPRRRRRHPQHGARRARHPDARPGRRSPSASACCFRAPLWDARRRAPPRHLLPRPADGRRRSRSGRPDRWVFASRRPASPADVGRRSAPRRPSGDRTSTLADRARRRASPTRSSSPSASASAARSWSATPPTGSPRAAATGMNTAIRDGYDLGWKLAWVLRGWAGEELLDSYEAERRPVAEHNGARGDRPQRLRARRRRGAARRPRRPHRPRLAAGRDRARVDARPARRRAHALHRARLGQPVAAPRHAARSPSAGSTPSPPARSGSSAARRCWCGPTACR